MVYQGPGAEVELPPAVAGPAFLSDGTEVWVRPVQRSDRDILLDLLEREAPALSRPSAAAPTLTEEDLLAPGSPDERLCLLVLGERTDRVTVLGVGEYRRLEAGSPVAEVAFLVGGPFRDQGIATLLLSRLARAALTFGIVRFEAHVGPGNPEMLEVFRGSGVRVTEEEDTGGVDVQIPLAPEVGAHGASLAAPSITRPRTSSPRRGTADRPPALGRLRPPTTRSRL